MVRQTVVIRQFYQSTMSISADLFFGLLLNIFHAGFSVYLQIRYLRCVFYKHLYILSNFFCNSWKRYNFESEFIERTLRNYSKIPKHLTFAIGEESISYEDLVQIILWTIPTGVSILSFYDHKNELKADKLYQTFLKNYRELTSCIKWGVSFEGGEDCEEMQLIYGAKPHLQVNVLDSKHGRQLLIDSIKELSRLPDIKLIDRATTEAALDDMMLQKLSYCGNPDLLVINGNVYTTYGLSPWHIGFTEFLTVPSYKLLTVSDFVAILRMYANCEQKFGR